MSWCTIGIAYPIFFSSLRGRGGLGQVQPASSHQLHHLLISRRGSSSPLCSSVPLSQDWSLLHNARRECSTRASVETGTGAVCTSPLLLVLQSQASPPRCRAAPMELVSRRKGAETEEAADPPPPFQGPAGSQGWPVVVAVVAWMVW